MDYIMINESKLKIMLEAKDLEEWDIRIDELDYSNPYAKIIFEEILDYAKSNLGFDSDGRKVLLQLYPSKDGGCELFITRMEETFENASSAPKASQRAYSFEKLSHLLAVCQKLYQGNYVQKSSAWFDGEGKWFLILYNDSAEPTEDDQKDRFMFISEYGEREEPNFLSLYLNEYATPVCDDDATQILGKI